MGKLLCLWLDNPRGDQALSVRRRDAVAFPYRAIERRASDSIVDIDEIVDRIDDKFRRRHGGSGYLIKQVNAQRFRPVASCFPTDRPSASPQRFPAPRRDG